MFGSLWHFITKWDRYFITKSDKALKQNASGVLLQNSTILLSNVTAVYKIATNLLQNVKVITKRISTTGKNIKGEINIFFVM